MLKNILYNDSNFENSDKFLKYKFTLINTLLLTAITISFFIAFVFMFIGSPETQSLIISLELIYGCLNIGLFFLLRHNKKNLKLVVYISMASLYFLQVIIMINVTEDSSRQAWYFLTIIMSFFLAGKRFGNFMLILVFLTMLLYNTQPFLETNLNIVESIILLILLLIIGFVMNLYENTKENYANSLEETNILLENKIKELNEFNTNLENRVQDEVKKNRQNEHKLFEQTRMVAMGEMIGNIAHQWRQPLSIISTISTAAKLQKDMGSLKKDSFDKDMDIINSNVQYLSQTIDDFRNYIKGETTKKMFVLNEQINSFLHLVEGNIKNNYIDVILDLEDDIHIIGYSNELIQCFINIFNNAKDVVKKSSEDDRLIFIKTYKSNGNAIIIFKDNGGGIPKHVISKIFDPYFTTKHQSQGTGLGLNMVYKFIVEGMNGNIEVENSDYIYNGKEHRGAQFKIILQLDDK